MARVASPHLLIACLFVSLVALSGGLVRAQSKTYFVSPAGSDLNDGLSQSTPLKTINRGVSLATSGDTVYLLPGTYRELVRIISRKGVAERPLCLYGYSTVPGMRPVIDGGATVPSNTNVTNYWIDIENSDWIEIGSIEFRNGWTNPIQVINSSYITFDGCAFFGGKRVINGSGINTHHVLVQNCTWDQGGDYLWRLVTDPAGADAWTSMHDGALQYYNGSLIAFGGTGGSIVIRNNVVMNAFNGIRWSAQVNRDGNVEIYDNTISNIRDNDFEPEYFTFNLHIYHNRSHNIHRTMSVDHVRGGFIYYYGNRATSDNDSWSNQIASSFWKIYGAGATNLEYPMIAFNNSFCGVGKLFTMDAGTIAVQFKHYNNAYFLTGSRTWVVDAIDSTDEFDYDVSNKTWSVNLTSRNQEAHGLVDDVQFVNAQTYDLHLRSTSPGIDRGKRLSLPELGWTQSFRGAGPDVGAYEGTELQEGPPFRFRTMTGLIIPYVEKPRLVRSRIDGSTLSLFFSSPLDPSSITASSVVVSLNGSPAAISTITLTEENYRLNLMLQAGQAIDENSLSLAFSQQLRGANGEQVTKWAAALPSFKKSIVTSVPDTRPSLQNSGTLSVDIYPNPVGPQSHVAIRLPSAGQAGAVVVKLYDIVGRMLEEKSLQMPQVGSVVVFPLRAVPTGTYFTVVSVGDKIVTKKFVVVR